MCCIERETRNLILKTIPWKEKVLRAHGMKSYEKPFFCQINVFFFLFLEKWYMLWLTGIFLYFWRVLKSFLSLMLSLIITFSRGGATQLFLGRYVPLGCNLDFWTCGLVNWLKWGSCELSFVFKWSLSGTEILKFPAFRLRLESDLSFWNWKLPCFLQFFLSYHKKYYVLLKTDSIGFNYLSTGVLRTDFCFKIKWGLVDCKRGMKRGHLEPYIHIPLQMAVPTAPPPIRSQPDYTKGDHKEDRGWGPDGKIEDGGNKKSLPILRIFSVENINMESVTFYEGWNSCEPRTSHVSAQRGKSNLYSETIKYTDMHIICKLYLRIWMR